MAQKHVAETPVRSDNIIMCMCLCMCMCTCMCMWYVPMSMSVSVCMCMCMCVCVAPAAANGVLKWQWVTAVLKDQAFKASDAILRMLNRKLSMVWE